MVFKFSLRLSATLLFLHGAVAVVVVVTDVPVLVRLAMLLFIMLSLFYYLARDVYYSLPGSWRSLSLERDDVSIITRDGARLHGRLSNGTLVSSYLIVLRVKLDGVFLPRSRVIFPDGLHDDEFRECCIRLKFI